MLKKSFFQIMLMGMVVLSFPSCHGILDDIYDMPQEEANKEFGFIESDETTHTGKIYVDATSYTQWIYLDFEDQEMYVTNIDKEKGTEIEEQPASWDLALHRYDAKTNEGSILETSYNNLSSLQSAGKMPEGTFVADVQGKVTTDMSGMMDGNILYADSPVNEVLLKWLDVNTSTMPPVYTLSKKVYVLKTKEGKYAALYLSNYMNNSFVKGFMTIDYIYPLEF